MNKKIKTPQEMFEEKSQRIELRMNEKDKQIAYFNSVNAAIELLKSRPALIRNPKVFRKLFIAWRDCLYEEWQAWYLENIIPPRQEKQRIEENKKIPVPTESLPEYSQYQEEEIKRGEEMRRAELESEANYL